MNLANRKEYTKGAMIGLASEWQIVENDFASVSVSGDGDVRKVITVAGSKFAKNLKDRPEIMLLTMVNNEVVRLVVAIELEDGNVELTDADNIMENN
jgi:hypothetical protein